MNKVLEPSQEGRAAVWWHAPAAVAFGSTVAMLVLTEVDRLLNLLAPMNNTALFMLDLEQALVWAAIALTVAIASRAAASGIRLYVALSASSVAVAAVIVFRMYTPGDPISESFLRAIALPGLLGGPLSAFLTIRTLRVSRAWFA